MVCCLAEQERTRLEVDERFATLELKLRSFGIQTLEFGSRLFPIRATNSIDSITSIETMRMQTHHAYLSSSSRSDP